MAGPSLNPHLHFYRDVLLGLKREALLGEEDEVLFSCAGPNDRDVALALGLRRVVMSNLDERQHQGDKSEFAPYEWRFIDCEQMSLADRSFDWVVVHSGLHHCHSPHRGLLEMYRVARKGIIFFEPLDSWFTRLGSRVAVGQEYELAAVFDNDCKWGGVANSEIPNYVYRWTASEFKKTINTFSPHLKHSFRFFYKLRMPRKSFQMSRNKLKPLIMGAAEPFLMLMSKVFKSFNNNCAFVALIPSVPQDLQPWIAYDEASNGFRVDAGYLRQRFSDHAKQG